ncbi:glutathione transferase omega-1 [Saccharata proteae CBS 121410]|uniref:Glutathione transferase omega-1 n=1 Tax=Saccharata proteae CBS 121410 TaxID=1314787 RepID=A0A9P4HVE4_9PEZI|nr:glutathione transferase omega-1 [Saccharata proteae CBS 121410]
MLLTKQRSEQKEAHPDSHIYPEASGPAKPLVEARSAEQPLKLYAGWFCPFVQRIWLILEEKKIPYQYIEVNPYHKPDSLLKLNPRGLVPTLQYDNKPLYESTVIAEFLEDAYPQNEPRLLPKDPYDKARMKIWSDFVTSRVIPSWHRFLQFQPGGGEGEEGLERVRKEMLGYLREFTAEMDKEGPFWAGKEPSMIDFVIAPWVVRSWVFDHFKGGSGIPKEGESGDDDVWKRWRKYASAIENRKSVKETTSEKEHYLPLYKRYADNTAQSEMAKATRSGRGVP